MIGSLWSLLLLLISAPIWATEVSIGGDEHEEENEQEKVAPEPIGASRIERDDLVIHQAILPGDLIDWTLVSNPGVAQPVIALLVEDEDERSDLRQLFSWRLSEPAVLEQLGPGLSVQATALAAFDIDDDGSAEVLVANENRMLWLDGQNGWTPRFEAAADIVPVGLAGNGKVLLLESIGELIAVEADAKSDGLTKAWSIELPLTVDRRWAGLHLQSPPISEIGNSGDRFLVGPEAHGRRRVRTMMVDTAAAEPVIAEAWSLFSQPEELQESWYLELEGEPVLAVTTVLADKKGVFEKKKLRLFPLEADRSRAGSNPTLEVMTRSRFWYGTCVGIADVNGDGVGDLVSAQPKGLGAGKLWVEAHLSLPSGRFEPKPRGSEIPVEEGEACRLDKDVSGDGVIDLVVATYHDLYVFELLKGSSERTVVSEEASWRSRLERIHSRPRVLAAFEGEAAQILVWGRTEGRRQVVKLVELR